MSLYPAKAQSFQVRAECVDRFQFYEGARSVGRNGSWIARFGLLTAPKSNWLAMRYAPGALISIINVVHSFGYSYVRSESSCAIGISCPSNHCRDHKIRTAFVEEYLCTSTKSAADNTQKINPRQYTLESQRAQYVNG